MAGYRSSFEELQITRDEVERIGNALKKEEFRKLLLDYVEEINDPENKKKYEEEITLLEKERGVDVTFVNPEPGYVIKTSVDGQKKAFINVCKSDKLKKPTSTPATKCESHGMQWTLPYSQAPPREDMDKSKERCIVYDVVFHPDTHRMAESNIHFKNMLNETALDAVENNFNVTLDRKNIRFPKMSYKGTAQATVIRKKSSATPVKSEDVFDFENLKYPYSSIDETSPKNTVREASKKTEGRKMATKDIVNENNSQYTTPKYVIKHRSQVDVQDFTNDKSAKMNAALPKELVVEVNLPLLTSSEELILDVMAKSIALQSEKPAKYKLHLTLPYTVDEDAGNAKFDKSLHKLIVTLPLKYRRDTFLTDMGREDSGVESDLGYRTHESSSGDDDSIESENNNSKIEDLGKRTEMSSTLSDQYRTNSVSESAVFLNPDFHYSLPTFTCNDIDNTLAFTLHVKNVDPSSVDHCFLGNQSCGVHVRFSSVGSGFFPIHHAFCLKFPPGISISQESLNIETWDNNVIVQIQLKSCVSILTEYYTGVNEDILEKHDLPEPAVIARKLEELQVKSCVQSTASMKVDVTKSTTEELTVKISSAKYENSKSLSTNKEEEVDDDDDEEDDDDERNSNTCTEARHSNYPLEKCRTWSESSGEELGYSPTKKGILKYKGRFCRSLSESSVDDYAWRSSLDMIEQSGGSDSCIPEEDEETGVKKTVRFNETVSQKVYRTNSSILGQRKKNQRKMRNKKRAQERRVSESETSEGEVEREKEKGREKKTEEDEEEDEEELNNNNGDDNGDEDPCSENVDEVFESQVSLTTVARKWMSTVSKRKKKSQSKGDEAVLKDQSRVPQLDFRNDFIFDLDM